MGVLTKIVENEQKDAELIQLRKENTEMRILLHNYVKAEHNHDEAYDQDRSYTEDRLIEVRTRVYEFLRGGR